MDIAMLIALVGDFANLLFGRGDHGWSRSRKIVFWTLAFLTLSAATVGIFALLTGCLL